MIVQGMDTAIASSSEWPVQPERYAVVQVGLQFNPLPGARARIEERARKAELVQVLILQIPAFLKQRFTMVKALPRKRIFYNPIWSSRL
jgi:hypothetical protein